MTLSEYLAILSNPKGRESSLLQDQEEYCLGPGGVLPGTHWLVKKQLFPPGQTRDMQTNVYGREQVLIIRLPRPVTCLY